MAEEFGVKQSVDVQCRQSQAFGQRILKFTVEARAEGQGPDGQFGHTDQLQSLPPAD